MHEAFQNSYKGFYCSICNYNTHEYFMEKERIIQYSEKFCRDLITTSLSSLLFFYEDIVKYTNLVSKFLLSCDKNGEFEADIPIPENVIFVTDDLIGHALEDCRKNRNSPSWIVHCAPVCEKFQWTKFAEYYEPELKRIENFIKFSHE